MRIGKSFEARVAHGVCPWIWTTTSIEQQTKHRSKSNNACAERGATFPRTKIPRAGSVHGLNRRGRHLEIHMGISVLLAYRATYSIPCPNHQVVFGLWRQCAHIGTSEPQRRSQDQDNWPTWYLALDTRTAVVRTWLGKVGSGQWAREDSLEPIRDTLWIVWMHGFLRNNMS